MDTGCRASGAFKLNAGPFASHEVGRVSHRLRYLLLGASGGAIDQTSSGLLFGPLTTWCAAGTPPCLELHVDPAVVKDILMAIEGDQLSSFCKTVAERVSILYTLYKTHTFPPEAKFPYYIGLFMDLHWAALNHSTLYAACKAGDCPEQLAIDSVIADESLRGHGITDRDVERIWDGVASGFVMTAFDPMGSPLPPTPHPHQKIDPRSTFPSHSVTSRSDSSRDAFVSLLRYCVTCTEVRYIKRTLIRKLEDDPSVVIGHRHLITDIVRRGMLGAYQHANHIASPVDRLKIYTSAPGAIRAALVHSTSRTQEDPVGTLDWVGVVFEPQPIFMVLTEYILSITRHHPAVLRALQLTTPFTAYSGNIFHNMDVNIRAKKRPSISGPLSIHKARRLSDMEVYDILYGVFKVCEFRPPGQLRLVVSGGTSLQRLASLVRAQRGSMQIHQGILVEAGICDADIAAIEVALRSDSSESECRSAIRKLLDVVTAKGRAKFVHYLWLIAKFSRTGYKWNGIVDTSPCDDVVLCTNCNSPVSENIESQRRTMGVELDIITGDVRCPECSAASFIIIPVSMYTVYTLSDGANVCEMGMCHRCRWAMARTPNLMVGQNTFCSKCYVHESNSHVQTRCICGVTVERRRNYGAKFLVRLDDGAVEQRILCDKHSSFGKISRWIGPMPQKWYDAFISTSKRTSAGNRLNRTLPKGPKLPKA